MSYIYLFIMSGVAVVASSFFTLLSGGPIFPDHMANIFIVAFLPIFVPLWRYIRQTNNQTIIYDRAYLVKLLFTISLIIDMLIVAHPDIYTLITVSLMLLIVFLGLDERYLFALALFYLLLVPVMLMLYQQSLAEYYSIHAYYALLLGVTALIFGKRVSSFLDKRLPHTHFPSFWNICMLEILWISSLVRIYLPISFITLLIFSYLSFGDFMIFNDNIITLMTLLIAFIVLVQDKISVPVKKVDSLLPGIGAVCLFFMFLNFSLIESLLSLIFYGSLFLLIKKSFIAQYYNILSSYLLHG